MLELLSLASDPSSEIHPKYDRGTRSGTWLIGILCLSVIASLWACDASMPSARIERAAILPVPPELPVEPAAPEKPQVKTERMSARSLVRTTFENHPDIKSSYQRFKVEEASYDFFYVSRDSLTPRLSLENSYEYSSFAIGPHEWNTEHALGLGVEKRFFDTTSIDIAGGVTTDIDDGHTGYAPFLSARMRYPLGGSREKLQRASEDIFRQNELDDAQLEYIEQVRRILRRAMEQFYEVLELGRRVTSARQWKEDLVTLEERCRELLERPSDLLRSRAEITQAGSTERNLVGRREIEMARLKTATGLPYDAEIELDTEIYNPFSGQSHEEVMKRALEVDPEIATLGNSATNARVQLDLALRGNWDIALVVSGRARPGGWGEEKDNVNWFAAAGVEIAKVDKRVTSSLIRQARANILRFARAIDARRREIHVTTLDPLIRIETLGTSRTELIENLARLEADYQSGLALYLAGDLNIDDLLSRRSTLFRQDQEVAELTNSIGENVAELFAATGNFFVMLDQVMAPRK
jgi:outer membrane protein TolC